MPTIPPLPTSYSYDFLNNIDDPKELVRQLVTLLRQNEKSLTTYLERLNSAFEDSVSDVVNVATVVSNITLTSQAVGFTAVGGITPRTLTVDADLIASRGINVTGTANRISAVGGTSLSQGGSIGTIDIAPNYAGQASITTVGSVSTGTWNAGQVSIPVGLSGARMLLRGNFLTQQFPAGVGNALGTADTVLAQATLPANTMAANSDRILLEASGTFAANTNDKRLRLTFGGVTIFSSGIVTHNAVDWYLAAKITRIDATHVSCSTYVLVHNQNSLVGNLSNQLIPSLTLSVTPITLLGASPTSGIAGDVVAYTFDVDFSN